MATLVLLELEAKEGQIGALIDYASSLLPVTREQPGLIRIDLWVDPDKKDTMVAVEEWESRQAYEAYFSWRAESGVIEKLLAFAAGQPTIRYFEAAKS